METMIYFNVLKYYIFHFHIEILIYISVFIFLFLVKYQLYDICPI